MVVWKPARNQAGQSLVEILIAMAVITVVLVTLVAAVVMAIRGVRFSKEKIRANFLAAEGLEWVRNQRGSLGWVDFALYATAAGARYCLKDLTLGQIGACGDNDLVSIIFTRELVLSTVGTSGVKAIVTVSWNDGVQAFNSEIQTTFRQWEVE